MQLIERAAIYEDDWQKYDLSASYLSDFALRELVGMSLSTYNLRELFSVRAITALVAFCVETVNANRKGYCMVSAGSHGGRGARPLEDGLKFEALLRDWAAAGWISVTENSETGEISASVVM